MAATTGRGGGGGHFLAGGVHLLRLKLAPSVHSWQLKMDLGSTFGSKKWTGGPVLIGATFSMTGPVIGRGSQDY